jgi:hypothetical protein
MKIFSNILLCVIIIFGVINPCLANPLSSIISFFQRDLKINVLYKNHKNLIQGSEVYLADDPKGQKVLIGKVRQVSLMESQMSKVEIIIDKKYKEKIFDVTPFVLMSKLFSKDSNAYIVAISSLEASDKKQLKSGSSVNGITFLEYKIATAGGELKKIMDSIKKQNQELISQLEQYIDTFNTEAFHKKMNDFINRISEFSTEQKETFKKEVLPSLKKALNSMMEKLQEQNNMEKSRDLKEQLKKIEDMVDA